MENVFSMHESDKVPDPFKRRESLVRSPPHRSNSISDFPGFRSPYMSEMDIPSDSTSKSERPLELERSQGPKRNREDTPPKPQKKLKDDREGIKELISELTKVSLDLVQAVKVNVNTKMDIKTGIRKAHRLIETLNRRRVELEINEEPDKEKTGDNHRQPEKKEPDTAIMPTGKKMVNIATQTTNVEEEEKTKERVWKSMGETKEWHKLQDLMSLEWPLTTYRVVTEEIRDPMQVPKDQDICIYLTKDVDIDKGNHKCIMDEYPDLLDTSDEGLINEGLTFMVKNIKKPRKDPIYKHIFMLCAASRKDKGREAAYQRTYENFIEIKEEMKRKNKNKLTVIPLEKEDLESIKKIMEYTFIETDIRVEIGISRREREKMTASKVGEQAEVYKRRSPRTDALILKAEGKTYAEMLRAIKEAAPEGENGIKAAKKTRNGEVLLTMEGGRDKISTLKTAITNKVEGVQTRCIRKGETILHLSNVDAITTREEVRTSIQRQINAADIEIEIRSLRPTQRENQIATVAVDSDTAKKLLELGQLRIGFNTCRVRERVDIIRCYRCHGYGHVARACSAPSRENLCLKCGTAGHKASECKGETHCVSCEKDGHRTGTLSCPIYRKMVTVIRRKSVNRYDSSDENSAV